MPGAVSPPHSSSCKAPSPSHSALNPGFASFPTSALLSSRRSGSKGKDTLLVSRDKYIEGLWVSSWEAFCDWADSRADLPRAGGEEKSDLTYALGERLESPLCSPTQSSNACPGLSGSSCGGFCSTSRPLIGPPSAFPRLFTYVDEKLFSKPTYAAFINLLNNYQRATGHGEHFSAQQLAEQDAFLREVMKTAVMKELYGFLRSQSE